MNDLLDLATELTTSGGGRPRSAALRRATSTAYYAVFHALARLCAAELVGWGKPWAVVTPIYRSLEHRRAGKVLDELRRLHPRNPSLNVIAITFLQLQKARHDADYDPGPFQFNRNATRELISEARTAVDLIAKLSADDRLMLAVRLIATTR